MNELIGNPLVELKCEIDTGNIEPDRQMLTSKYFMKHVYLHWGSMKKAKKNIT